jgi:hypothetical protein
MDAQVLRQEFASQVEYSEILSPIDHTASKSADQDDSGGHDIEAPCRTSENSVEAPEGSWESVFREQEAIEKMALSEEETDAMTPALVLGDEVKILEHVLHHSGQ